MAVTDEGAVFAALKPYAARAWVDEVIDVILTKNPDPKNEREKYRKQIDKYYLAWHHFCKAHPYKNEPGALGFYDHGGEDITPEESVLWNRLMQGLLRTDASSILGMLSSTFRLPVQAEEKVFEENFSLNAPRPAFRKLWKEGLEHEVEQSPIKFIHYYVMIYGDRGQQDDGTPRGMRVNDYHPDLNKYLERAITNLASRGEIDKFLDCYKPSSTACISWSINPPAVIHAMWQSTLATEAQKDPFFVARYWKELPPEMRSEEALIKGAEAWTQRDPLRFLDDNCYSNFYHCQSVRESAVQQPLDYPLLNHPQKDRLFVMAMTRLAKINPERFLDRITNVEPPFNHPELPQMLSAVAQTLLDDPDNPDYFNVYLKFDNSFKGHPDESRLREQFAPQMEAALHIGKVPARLPSLEPSSWGSLLVRLLYHEYQPRNNARVPRLYFSRPPYEFGIHSNKDRRNFDRIMSAVTRSKLLRRVAYEFALPAIKVAFSALDTENQQQYLRNLQNAVTYASHFDMAKEQDYLRRCEARQKRGDWDAPEFTHDHPDKSSSGDRANHAWLFRRAQNGYDIKALAPYGQKLLSELQALQRQGQ